MVAKANSDWISTIENARISWLQKQHNITKVNQNMTSEIKTAVQQSVSVHFRKIESKLEETIRIQEEFVVAIVESLKSANDVEQITHKRIKNRKLRKSLRIPSRNDKKQGKKHQFILSDGSSLPLPSPESSLPTNSLSEAVFNMEDLSKVEYKRGREKSSQGETESGISSEELTTGGYKRASGRASEEVTWKRSKNEKFALIDGCYLPLPSP